MKKIRLVVPIGTCWKNLSRVWLKVNENQTEAFEDREWTKPIQKDKESVVIYVDVPKELSLIEIVGLGGMTPADDISMGWCMDEAKPNWRVSGLKKVTIIMDDLVHEVPVIDERPDKTEWDRFKDDNWLSSKTWAMEVYTLTDRTIAAFHWHPNLIERASHRIRPIQLSKRNKLPCIWEKGGLESEEKGGRATIICLENGEKIKPIFVNNRGKISCGEHALIVVREGNVVIDTTYLKGNVRIKIWQIEKIYAKCCEMEVHKLAEFSHYSFENGKIKRKIAKFDDWNWGEGKGEIAKKYEDAIFAALEKATCYHCREPHFVYRNR